MPENKLALYRKFARLVPATLILVGIEADYELGDSRTTSQPIGRRELFDEIHRRSPDSLAEVTTFDEVRDLALDVLAGIEFHPVTLETAEQAERRAADARRARLEQEAARIARAHNVAVGSLEFIAAVHVELDRFASYREGLREDGLCIGFGVTPDQWLDEYNDSQGDTANARCRRVSTTLPSIGSAESVREA